MNRERKPALILFAATILANATAGAQRTSMASGVVLNGVTIVDTRTGALKPNQAIVIDAGKIVKIANAGTVAASSTAKVVDARGK